MMALPAIISAASAIGGHFLEKSRAKKERKAFEKQYAREKKLYKNPKQGVFNVGTLSGHQKKTLNDLLASHPRKQYDISQQPLFKQGQQYLGDLLSNKPGAFEAFEAPIKKQFYEEEVPQLAERFTKNDAQRSSAFQQAFARAGEDLSLKLASLREGLKSGAASQAFSYAQAPVQSALNRANLGLATPTFQTLNRTMPNPRPVAGPGFAERSLGGISGGFSSALGQ